MVSVEDGEDGEGHTEGHGGVAMVSRALRAFAGLQAEGIAGRNMAPRRRERRERHGFCYVEAWTGFLQAKLRLT
jgi:hypothetical protein